MFIVTKSPSQSNFDKYDKDWYEDHEFTSQAEADAFKQQLLAEDVWVVHWTYPNDSGSYIPS